jgi:hypothetical protein
MEDDIEKVKKKLKKDFDELVDDSDIPVHEKRAKDKKIREI